MYTYAAYVYALKQILRHLKQYDDDQHRNLDQYKTKATTQACQLFPSMNNTMKHSMESFERNTQPEMSDFGNENVDFFKDSIGHRAYCDTLSIFYSMTKFCYGNTPNVTWLAR